MELQTEPGGAETAGEPAEPGRRRLPRLQPVGAHTAGCFLIDVQTAARPTHAFYGMFSSLHE